MAEKIKVAELEAPPSLERDQRILLALPALLRVLRAAKVCHETTELVADANPDNFDMQLGECDAELAAALDAFDFGGEP